MLANNPIVYTYTKIDHNSDGFKFYLQMFEFWSHEKAIRPTSIE